MKKHFRRLMAWALIMMMVISNTVSVTATEPQGELLASSSVIDKENVTETASENSGSGNEGG